MGSSSPPKTPDPIVVIADDLSGAAELAGIAYARGYSAEVQRRFDPTSDAQVISVDTDTRHSSPETAAQRVEQVARAVVAARPAWIYKKVDSVLRGNVRAEIEAMLRITKQSRAILIPANPSRGRTIDSFRLLIDGVPLDQTPFRDDPDYPRNTSLIDVLLGDGTLAVYRVSTRSALPKRGIAVPDVRDLVTLHQRISQIGQETLIAGAADFFAILLDRRARRRPAAPMTTSQCETYRPILLVCGSRIAWQVRAGQCASSGVPIMLLPKDADALTTWANTAAARVSGTGTFTIAIDPMTAPTSGQSELLSRLATATDAIMSRSAIGTLMVEGGATAAALAEHFGWQRLQVVAAAAAGVGVLKPIGVHGAPTILIKPGSYPWPDEIWRQFAQP